VNNETPVFTDSNVYSLVSVVQVFSLKMIHVSRNLLL